MLRTVTFNYNAQEDRVLAAINLGKPEAWSGWLTRRLVLMLLEHSAKLLANTSALAQRAPANIRGELVAFERDAAIAKTAKAMSPTPVAVLKPSESGAELVHTVKISGQGDNVRVELRGEGGGGAAGVMKRAEFQRILLMLQTAIAKADWLDASARPAAAPVEPAGPSPARH